MSSELEDCCESLERDRAERRSIEEERREIEAEMLCADCNRRKGGA